MSLLDLAYPQQSLAEALRTTDLPLDGTVALPWVGDQLLLADSAGNALGFVTQNEIGGVTITDEHMGIEAVTAANSMGGHSILDGSFNQEAFTVPNSFGSENLYSSDFTLEGISFETPLGETMYSSDMEVLGITDVTQDALNFTSFHDFSVDATAFHSLNDFASTAFMAHGDNLTLLSDAVMDFDFDYIDACFGIFDWL